MVIRRSDQDEDEHEPGYTTSVDSRPIMMTLYRWSIMPGRQSEFVGLENYMTAINDPIFWVAVRNSILYSAVTVPGIVVLGLLMALLMNHTKHGRVLFRTAYYLPVITSWVIVSLLFKYLFQWPGGWSTMCLPMCCTSLRNRCAGCLTPPPRWSPSCVWASVRRIARWGWSGR